MVTTLKIDFSNIQGQLTPQSRVQSGSNSNSSKMVIHVSSKNEEDMIKIEGTIQNIDFSNTKGQLTPQSDLAEIQAHPRYCSYSCYLQE